LATAVTLYAQNKTVVTMNKVIKAVSDVCDTIR
jgi:hypothetical protein